MEKNMGKKGTDKITGFSGIITGFCAYLTGCNQYLLTPKCSDTSKYPEGEWLDAHRIEVEDMDKDVHVSGRVQIDTAKDKGADKPAPRY